MKATKNLSTGLTTEENYLHSDTQLGIGNTISHTLGAMCVRKLEKVQRLPLTPKKAWDFFCNPENLVRITPPQMRFIITSSPPPSKQARARGIHSGQVITYRVSVLPGIRMGWTTEIKAVKAPEFFIDEQRFGPYSFWHHQHHISPIPGGVEIIDLVHYRIPLIAEVIPGLNHLLHWPIRRQLDAIFEYRYKTLQDLFPWPKKRAKMSSKNAAKATSTVKTKAKRKSTKSITSSGETS